MKFLIDAHLPQALCRILDQLGYDAIHTLDLPNKNKSKDKEINLCTLNEKRILISKDSDFMDSLLISDKPYKLLYVSTGNITNQALKAIFTQNIHLLDEMFKQYRLVELTSKTIIIHQ